MEYSKAESVMKAAEDSFPEATVSVVSHKGQTDQRRYAVLVEPVSDADELKRVAEAEDVGFDLDGERARLHGHSG